MRISTNSSSKCSERILSDNHDSFKKYVLSKNRKKKFFLEKKIARLEADRIGLKRKATALDFLRGNAKGITGRKEQPRKLLEMS